MIANLRGLEIAYDDTGGALPPVLLIHGFPLDRTLWREQTRRLADIARLIAPDLRGLGESLLPSEGAVTLDDYASDLGALLDALGIERAVVGGLSMGGYIAFAFYRRYRSRVRALILANTRAGADSPEGKKGRDDNIALARTQGAAALADKMLPKLLIPKTAALRAQVADEVKAMMARQSVAGIVAALAAMRDRPDATPWLAEIAVPTLIIAGADDTLIPLAEAEALRDAIRGARLVTIPRAAHLSNVEQPDAFNFAVREFLRSLA